MNVTAYIGFGSNVGDLLKNLHVAKTKLSDHPQINLQRISHLYHSEPLTENGDPQPWYLNCVFEFTTSLSLHSLFAFFKEN